LQILVVESGLNNRDNPILTTPAFAWTNLVTPDSPFFDHYTSVPSDYLNGRAAVVDCGRVLGGGSSVNLMMYNRPAASDLNDWNTDGWSFEDLELLYKKVGRMTITLTKSLRLIGLKKGMKIMVMMGQFKFLMVALEAMLLLIFLLLPKLITELIALLT
jgi:choline dehydrogenase-like flavoprotein